MFCAKELYLLYVLSQIIYRWVDPRIFLKKKDCKCSLGDQFDWTNYFYDSFLLEEKIREIIDRSNKNKLSLDQIINSSILHLKKMQYYNGHIILWDSPQYPILLKMIKDPPLALNIIGDISLLSYNKVSVIGSRKASLRALFESEKLGYSLAEEGFAVVSGGAYGCDIAVHKGVLTSGLVPCPAIVVFAGGLGSYYPSGNVAVFEKLKQRNAIFLSERLFHVTPKPYDFPVRNRIVSGLSEELIVMQASKKSGAMVTSKLALEQGREVSALTFSELDLAADGSLQLIEDGAFSFNHAEDWIDGCVGNMNSWSRY